MLDAVDIRTDWAGLRALENRSQYCTLAHIRDLKASLPFALRGLDCDNGGEFLNHHRVAYLGQRPRPVLLTRARPWHKNDNAHVEQRNWTRVREHFGYERYDNPEVTPLINVLCAGALGHLINHFLPLSSWSRSNGGASAWCGSMGRRRRPGRGCWRRRKSAPRPRPACKPCTPRPTPSNWLGTLNGRRRPSKPGDVCRPEGAGDRG
jgi:hypothetical protein